MEPTGTSHETRPHNTEEPVFALPSSTRTALVDGETHISWNQLNELVHTAAETLGPVRRLVHLVVNNNVDSIVWYLAALSGQHPVLISGPSDTASSKISSTFKPDITIDTSSSVSPHINERHNGTNHVLHPELAVLLSTSGSVGSPKLVRLSRRNLFSNAQAIVEYLNITPSDRAITTLPMEYCYGLSVINSHLLAGASIVLNHNSVLDDCFWETFRANDVTSLAGVPHTFTLLDNLGFEQKELPSLRYVTQAGGRLPADKVSQYADLGNKSGWDFYVMYGQTEATARMAYLPPEHAASNPAAIGQPIPGGSLTLDTSVTSEPDTGELVFSGDNVMMGYASTPTDLSSGQDKSNLRTGDIGRLNSAGFYEIVGRTSRFVKPFGLRIDLDQIESSLFEQGIRSAAVGNDQSVHIAYIDETGIDVEQAVSDLTGLPIGQISASHNKELPLLPNGKTDYQTLLQEAEDKAATVRSENLPNSDVASIFATVLHRESVGPHETFVSLGGDSLTYIEAAVTLEASLGPLPSDWATTPISQLKAAEKKSRHWAKIDVTMLLRMVAILTIVSTHIGLVSLAAGAHILLGVAGFNFARFQLHSNQYWSVIARVVAPSAVWIGGLLLFSDRYQLSNLFFTHNWTSDRTWDASWRYWFIDVLVQILVVAALVLALPAVRRFERQHQFPFALGLMIPAIALRYEIFDVLDMGRTGARTPLVLWAFFAGWASAQAKNVWHRMLVSATIVVSVYDFYPNDRRVMMIGAGLLMIVWVRQIPVPRLTIPVITSIGQASLFIYLTHWQVFPVVARNTNQFIALLASLAAGLAAFHFWKTATPHALRLQRSMLTTLQKRHRELMPQRSFPYNFRLSGPNKSS